MLRSSHAIVVRYWLGLESSEGFLAHISGAWAKMAGKNGTWADLSMRLSWVTSQHGSLRAAGPLMKQQASPKICIPRGLGESFSSRMSFLLNPYKSNYRNIISIDISPESKVVKLDSTSP